MKRIYSIGISLFFLLLFAGCGSSNPTLATFGDEKITLRSYEDTYVKSSGGWDTCAASSLEEKQSFLDLIIKYKLKVKEARAQGLDKDSAVVDEINTYRNAAAQSYMVEKEVVEPGIQKFYDRKKEEVHASHILFRVPPKGEPKDTLAAYERAVNTIKQISSNPFDTLAAKFSDDPSAKTNYGDLGFFTAGRMVREFEEESYSLKPGEYSKKPIRTQFGYHILKVTGRQPNSGSVRISHILFLFPESLNDTAAIRDTAWMVYKMLKSGANFKDMVKKYSKDPQSVAKDGDMGFFERERLPANIAETFYSMHRDSITEPMGFRYGYHIFKLTEKKPLPDLKELYKDLKTQYQQSRFPYERKNYIAQLKTQYGVHIDSSAMKIFISALDSTKKVGSDNWKDTLTTPQLGSILLHCQHYSLTVDDFIKRVSVLPEYKNFTVTSSNIWSMMSKVADNVALEQHARHAHERYPILARLLEEYEEGVLLFRIEQDEVWKKVTVSDSILKTYYEAQKESYRWPVRVNFAEIYVSKDSIAKVVYKKIKKGMDFLEAAQEYTTRPGYKEKKGVWGLQSVVSNELSMKASGMVQDSITAPFRYQSGWSLLKALEKDSAHVKTYEEVLPEISSACQEIASKQREQDWVAQLKKKYPVKINQEVLLEAFKRKRVESQ
jgi:peptidyl-prolyl cis-trans isomerase SurA